MPTYGVRFENICGDYLTYTIEADNELEAFNEGMDKFENEDESITDGYELEGVFKHPEEE